MRTSKEGIDLIKRFEGFEPKAYLCPADVPTIGYGATYYPSNGNKVKLTDREITEQYAELLLADMLVHYEQGVLRYVTSKLSQYQFDALVSFAYNCGLGSLKTSTLLKRVNANPNDKDISYQFSRWNKAGRKVLSGLTRRRKDEARLYFKEVV